MNWDWDKLKEQQGKQKPNKPSQPSGGGKKPPLADKEEVLAFFRKFNNLQFPAGKIIIIILALLWLGSGIYIVGPQEVAVITRFGKYVDTTDPGPHYRLPAPIERTRKVNVTEVRSIEIGFNKLASNNKATDEALMLTGDENIVSVQFVVQYTIKNAENYLFSLYQPDETVRNVANTAIREVIGKSDIDAALTSGKSVISNETQALLQQLLDEYKSGIQVTAVRLQHIYTPDEVDSAVKDVASAREDKNRFINEAEAYSNDLLPRARGDAATITGQAEAYKNQKILVAEGEAQRFIDLWTEYKKAPNITEKRLYIETMEEIFSNPNVRKLLLSNDAAGKAIPYLPLTTQAPRGGK